MSLSPEWTKVLEAHCKRVVDEMSHDELKAYARQMKSSSFDACFGDGDSILEDLVDDIVSDCDTKAGDAVEAARQFIIGCGVSEEDADNALIDYN
jgi:hypothetical protein